MREWLKTLSEIDVDCVHQYEYLLGRPLRDKAEYLDIDSYVDEMVLEWTSRKEFFAAYPALEAYRKGREKDLGPASPAVEPGKREPQTGRKWFLEVVQDQNGTYFANMTLDGKLVEGLPDHVPYKVLRDAIRKETGVVILEKKDMKFERWDGVSYAFLDATQTREDCRVSLFDVRNGIYSPNFDPLPGCASVGSKVYIYPHASHGSNLNAPCILSGTVKDRTSGLRCFAAHRPAWVKVRITEAIGPDGTRRKLNTPMEFYDSPSLYALSLDEAMAKAAPVYSKIAAIKALPKVKEPAGPYAKEHFAVVDYKALSDLELVTAKDLAKEFVGPQSSAIDDIQKEMLRRFVERADPGLRFKVLSAEECFDKAYGETVVQYQAGDSLISFMFSNLDAKTALCQPERILQELEEKKVSFALMPKWSSLSGKLQEVILSNPFDMEFIEKDDPYWTQADADAIWTELCNSAFSCAVTCGEDDCLITVYAGAMGDVNWFQHPEYGKPCFEHKLPEPVKPRLSEQIQSAASRSTQEQTFSDEKGKGPKPVR